LSASRFSEMLQKKKPAAWSTVLVYLLMTAGSVEGAEFRFESAGHFNVELTEEWSSGEDATDRFQKFSNSFPDLVLSQSRHDNSGPCQELPHATGAVGDDLLPGITQTGPPKLRQLTRAACFDESTAVDMTRVPVLADFDSLLSFTMSSLRSTILLA
jgi:hypothetical protein